MTIKNLHSLKRQPAVLQGLLGQIVAAKEADLYLRRLQSLKGKHPLLIHLDDYSILEGLDDLVAAVSLLTSLGILPILAHQVSTHAPTPSDKETSGATQRKAIEENSRLTYALERRGVRAVGLTRGVFKMGPLFAVKSSDMRNRLTIDMAQPQHLLSNGIVPVIALLGELPTGRKLALPPEAVVDFSHSARPAKVVFLTKEGALFNRDQRCLSGICLTNDYDHLVIQSLVRADLQHLASQSYRLLEPLDGASSVSITRPDRLVRELFSHSGSGTLIRKGEPLIWHDHIGDGMAKTLTNMLESSFGRRLNPNWLSKQMMLGALLAESQRGAALIMRGCNGIPYLDKLLVTPAARGDGLGSAIWQALLGRFPALYWRSRTDNPINSWYFARAETSHRQGRWIVFSTGIRNFAVLKELTHDALARDSGWGV